MATLSVPTSVSAAYNCAARCYSYAFWYGGMNGAFAYDYVVNIYDGDNAGERINNELWVIDTHAAGLCVTQGFNSCWSEVGYTYIAGTNGPACQGFEHYFHAEFPPRFGYMEPCDWTQEIGLYHLDYHAYTAIYTQLDYTRTFFVTQLVSPSLGLLTAYTNSFTYSGYQVSPNLIWAGQEMTGHQYASAEQGSWSFNKYIWIDGNSYFQNLPFPYTSDHSVFVTPTGPQGGAYYAEPSLNNPAGGNFLANCCFF